MQRFESNVISLVGPPFVGLTPVPGVGLNVDGFTATILTFPALTTASIFSDNGITVKANPITVDSDGGFFFYAANGRYQINLLKAGIISRSFPDILVSDGRKTVSFTPASVAANLSAEQTVALAGLATGDFVAVSPPGPLVAGIMVGACRVSATNTLAITFMNTTVGPLTPSSGTFIVSHIPA